MVEDEQSRACFLIEIICYFFKTSCHKKDKKKANIENIQSLD